MEQIIIAALLFFFAMFASGNVIDKEYDLRVEEGHSLEGLMASKGCVIFEGDPFYINVNGREILCDLNTVLELSAENMARNEKLFERKLNEFSSISFHCLFLNDLYNTPISHVRLGRDPFGFFPNLPAACFDNKGNLISLTSYDIFHESYYEYTFFYDADDRITCAQERCYKIPLGTGRKDNDFSLLSNEWRYTEAGRYLKLTKRWDSMLNNKTPDLMCIEINLDGFTVKRKIYKSEEEFQADIEMKAEWTRAESAVYQTENEEP